MVRHLMVLLACSGCALGRGGPEFKQWYKSAPYQPVPGVHRGPSVTFEVLSASSSATYTALGIQACSVNLELRTTNHSTQPYEIERGENGIAGQMLFFAVSDRVLAPGQTLQTRHQVTVNPFSCANPGALVLDGVRVPINR